MSAGSWVLAAAVGLLTLVVLVLALVVVRQGRALRRLGPSATEPSPPVAERPQTPEDRVPAALVEPRAAEPDYVITHVGQPDQPDGAAERVPDRVVLSVALGEPLVKAVALGHGVRRALSAESRNKIWFHVRREVKRSRKVRRREMREAWRQVQAERARDAAGTSTLGPTATQRDVA